MQPIPLTFEDRTFRYTQLARQGPVAIYEQEHKEGQVKRYEVIRIRVQPAHTWPDGRTTPERETYPSATSWGTLGWTFHGLPEAQRWAQQLSHPTSAAAQDLPVDALALEDSDVAHDA